MEFSIPDFSFQTESIDNVADIDKLLEELEIELKTLTVRVDNNELGKTLASNRSKNLLEDIQELEGRIAAKQAELSNHTEGSTKHEDVQIELEALEVRLKRLNFRKKQTQPASEIVTQNVEIAEKVLHIQLYTKFQEALNSRKFTLTATS